MFELKTDDDDFPKELLSIETPPGRLWGEGVRSLLQPSLKISIVGTREATPYGKKIAFELSQKLGRKGVTVVSGLALGIDTEAHEGALSVGGKTIAVLGCGMDYPYLKENFPLKKKIGEKGLLLTEYPPGTPPTPWNFPQRNRIISALAQAVVVVEAGEKSGALITAEWALSQGREVYAIPGNITSPQSVGTNRLIQNGANPLLSIEDLFHTLQLPLDFYSRKPSLSDMSPRDQVLQVLEEGERSVDEIVELTGRSVSEICALLSDLEIQGKVRLRPGGRFVREV